MAAIKSINTAARASGRPRLSSAPSTKATWLASQARERMSSIDICSGWVSSSAFTSSISPDRVGGSRRSTAGSRQRSGQSLLERNIFNSWTGFRVGALVAPAATLANSASTIPIIPLAPAKEASATASNTQRASLSAPAGNPATVSATLSQVYRALAPVSESSSLCRSMASRAD